MGASVGVVWGENKWQGRKKAEDMGYAVWDRMTWGGGEIKIAGGWRLFDGFVAWNIGEPSLDAGRKVRLLNLGSANAWTTIWGTTQIISIKGTDGIIKK